MRIKHNISAINTYNQMQKNSETMNQSVQRLSTAVKINKAGDDAAGLSISEKMRGQIRGLNMAEKNISDGISLVRTAESGLAEIDNPYMVRLRELAIKAGNDTLTDQDRLLIQQEVEQIKKAINDTANNTHYNNIPLLNVPDGGRTEKIEQIGSTQMNVHVAAKESVIAGYIDIPDPAHPALLEVEAAFGTISGSQWPDLNIISPNGEKFGFDGQFLKGSGAAEDITNKSSTKASYNGYSAKDEKMSFEDPVSGRWVIEIRHDGGQSSSSFNINSNYLMYAGDPEVSTEVIDIPGQLDLQVGANAAQHYTIDLTDVRLEALGLEDLTMASRSEAEEAIALIDQASAMITSERVKHGLYSNALEHLQANVSNYKYHLTAAEANLRDLDVAKELTQLAKTQTLLEASQVMLAQSQQISQGILTLLQ